MVKKVNDLHPWFNVIIIVTDTETMVIFFLVSIKLKCNLSNVYVVCSKYEWWNFNTYNNPGDYVEQIM